MSDAPAPAAPRANAWRAWREALPDLERKDLLIALGLALGYVVLLLATVNTLGYARDEGFYFQAAQSYERWFETLFKDPGLAFDRKVVDGAWGVNQEHPALIKSLFALSHLVQKRLHLFAMEGTSYRFPAMVLSGAGIALVYVWGTQARGRLAGLCAAVLLAAMPRFFFHAHLACFDAPIVTMWTLSAYCYWRAVGKGGAAWPILAGVAFGLALDTKHNSWFLPILCVAHAALVQLRGLLAGRPARAEGRRALTALAAMATIGPLVFYALWPWIWHDTRARLSAYAAFHLGHDYYNMEFLGVNYWIPPMPRAYAPVMTAATVPTITLALFVAGLVLRARARLAGPMARLASRVGSRFAGERLAGALARLAARAREPAADPASTDLLWFLAIAASYGAWIRPTTPIFGGTKHWMTAYPFLCLFAGAAFSACVGAARREWAIYFRRRGGGGWLARAGRGLVPAVGLGIAVAIAPVVETARAHPFGLSSYTPLVGGAAGGATLGLNRGFWGYTTGAVAPYLNGGPRGASVYIHDTAGPSWDMLIKDGRLRRDVRGVWTIAGADYGLYHHEPHMLGQEYQNWIAFGTVRPDHVAGLDGVPVIWVYRRPGLK